MAKTKEEQAIQEEVKATKKTTKSQETITYKVIDNQVLNMIIHPKTRKVVTAKNGLFKVDKEDTALIEVLERASGTTKI